MTAAPPVTEATRLPWLSRVLIVVVLATLAIGLLLILFEPRGRWVEQLVASLMLAGLCTVVLSAAVAVARRRRRMFIPMAAGGVSCTGGTVMAIVVLMMDRWIDSADEALVGRIATTLIVLGFATVHAGALGVIPARTALLRIGRLLTIALVWFFTVGLVAALWYEDMVARSFGMLLFLPVAVSAFLGLLGTVGVGIGAASGANRPRVSEETIAARVAVELGCPHCGHRQTLRSGLHRCAGCRCAIVVEVEEPRCECGYLLYRLEGDRCPECGRPQGKPGTGATVQPKAGPC